MTDTTIPSPGHWGQAPPLAGGARVRSFGRALWLASILSTALSGCFYDEEDFVWPKQCCDSECGYFVSYRPVNWREEKLNFFTTYRTYGYGDCPAGTRSSDSLMCYSYWTYSGASPQCTIAAYWGATDGDGATIEAVEVGSTASTVTARITVYIPGTGVWTTPAALSIVGPEHVPAASSSSRRADHLDLIAYPGGVAMTYVTEREVKKGGTIRFGLLRIDDAAAAYPIGATQQQNVSLKRPRVSAVLGSAQ